MTSIQASKDLNAKPARAVKSVDGRMRKNVVFQGICVAATLLAISILIVLLLSILSQGIGALSLDFITSLNSSDPHQAGIWTSLFGTILICAICALSAIPLGVGTAVLIEEFKPKHPLLLKAHGIVDTNIRNLAGVPSIVYGILGVTVFATMFGVFGPIDSGRFAIGQDWYDQYVDATGTQLFVPVKNGEVPTVPLYAGPVGDPLKMEVWRREKDDQGRLIWNPVFVDTNFRTPAEILVDQDEERDGIQPLIDEKAPLLATLDVVDGQWLLKLSDEQSELIEFNSTKAGDHTQVRIGDTVRYAHFFDEGLNRLFYSEFMVMNVGKDSLALYGAPVTSFLTAKDSDAASSSPSIVLRSEFQPIKTEINKQLDAFKTVIRREMGDYLVSDENRKRFLKFPDGQEQATVETIVDEAMAQYPFKPATIEQLRPKLIEQMMALNGKSSGDVRTARTEFLDTASSAELLAQLDGKIINGQNPTRVDRKAWYHFSLPFGRGVLAGGLTLMLVILPIVIVASQEALRAVPGSYRQGALAMGATRWQAVSKTALPAAIPGICTGVILAISRAIGEAAPILVLGGTGFITSTPQNLMDKFSAMPMTIFQWTKEPEAYFKDIAAAGIIILLMVLLSFNAVAIYIRHRASKHH
ncbi:MAG: ABC transporter permease subunit [Planctomycetota bacterium]